MVIHSKLNCHLYWFFVQASSCFQHGQEDAEPDKEPINQERKEIAQLIQKRISFNDE